MDAVGGESQNKGLITTLLALFVASIAILTYRESLGYFFVDEDSLIIIDSSRIGSVTDFKKVVTLPLMSGSTVDIPPEFYRPTSSLSYSLDYAIWRLNPFGYHLTNLLLHAGTSVLVFLLMLRLSLVCRAAACLGALIFATHPALLNIVPAPARRQDILATFFLLLSLLTCLKYHGEKPGMKSIFAVSIFTSLLALGAKEIAIILPFLVLLFLIAARSSPETQWKRNALSALKASLPYFMTTIFFLMLRAHILKGVGSYAGRSFKSLGAFESLRFLLGTVLNYFTDLLYPLAFLCSLFSYSPGVVAKVLSGCLVMALLIFLVRCRNTTSRILLQDADRRVRVGKALLLSLASIAAICILAFPLAAPSISRLVVESYQGQGPAMFVRALAGQDRPPVGHFIERAKNLTLRSSALAFLFSSLGLLGVHRRRQIRSLVLTSASAATILVLLVWLILPLMIYSLTLTYAHRYIYASVVPFAMLLSVICFRSFHVARDNDAGMKTKGPALPNQRTHTNLHAFIFTGVVCFMLLNLSRSSILVGDRFWAQGSTISALFFRNFEELIPDIPPNAVVYIHGLPKGPDLNGDRSVFGPEYSFPGAEALRAWLNLRHPRQNLSLAVGSELRYGPEKRSLRLELKVLDHRRVDLTVHLD